MGDAARICVHRTLPPPIGGAHAPRRGRRRSVAVVRRRCARPSNELLCILMTICSLGKEWEDPSKIPVDEIVEEWRSGSSRGRYEAAMWKEANLEMQA